MERGSIYPSWRYHRDGRSVLCEGPEQDEQLGSNWSDRDIRDFSPKAPISVENSVENVDVSEKPALVPTSDGVGTPKKRKPKA